MRHSLTGTTRSSYKVRSPLGTKQMSKYTDRRSSDRSSHKRRELLSMMQRLVGSIVKHYNVPRGNWEVRDVHMDMFLVRTNLHDISDYPLPKIYNFTRHTIFDKRNLDLVCNPFNTLRAHLCHEKVCQGLWRPS